MRLSDSERAHNRAAFGSMSLAQKAEYILAYYKLPLVIALVVAVAVGSVLHRQLTHKEPLLYVGYANATLPDEQDERVFDGYLQSQGADPRTTEVYRYYGLYLAEQEETTDHQMSYASRVKLLAAIDAQQLDVVLMSKSAYTLLSHSGYLLDLEAWLQASDSGLLPDVDGLLVSNDVIVEDNQVEVDLGEADEYIAKTTTCVNALNVSDLPAFAQTDLSDDLYLGVISNSPRLDEALDLVAYLCS